MGSAVLALMGAVFNVLGLCAFDDRSVWGPLTIGGAVFLTGAFIVRAIEGRK